MDRDQKIIWRKSEQGKNFSESFPAYKGMEEFYKDLSEIEKINYQVPETSNEDAVEHGKKVLSVILKARNLTSEMMAEHENVAKALRAIGCVSWQEADKKFQTGKTIDETLYQEDVSFPLTAYGVLLSDDKFIFYDGLNKILGAGVDFGWVVEWLSTQEFASHIKGNQPSN